MPQSPDFKLCAVCHKPMPVSNPPPHKLLKVPGGKRKSTSASATTSASQQALQAVHTEGQGICLKALLIEVALRLALEPSHSNSVLSTSTLIQSAPPALGSQRHHSPSPMPRHRRQRAERECSPTPKKDKKGVAGEGPEPGHLPSAEPKRHNLHLRLQAQKGNHHQLLGVPGGPCACYLLQHRRHFRWPGT